MLYRRDRALEVVPVDGINGPAVEGEAPLETLEALDTIATEVVNSSVFASRLVSLWMPQISVPK